MQTDHNSNHRNVTETAERQSMQINIKQQAVNSNNNKTMVAI